MRMVEFEVSSRYYIDIAEAFNAGQFEEATAILRELNQMVLQAKIKNGSSISGMMVVPTAGAQKKKKHNTEKMMAVK